MPSATPNKAIPFALDADPRALWPTTSQDAAEQVDALLTAMDPLYKSLATEAGAALSNNVWTTVGYTAADDGALTYDGGGGVTITATRWYLVSFGLNVAVNGSQPSASVQLMLADIGLTTLSHTDNYSHLGGAVPLKLTAGTVVSVRARAVDGSGALGGAYDNAWLRIAAL
jgi:hypothetical protein